MDKKILLILLFSISISLATNFNACTTFNTPDNYTLTQNITYNGTCLVVNTGIVPATPTLIDCQGFSLVGNSSGNGILIQNSDNVTIQNCNISTNYDNIVVVNSSNGIIQNNDLWNDSDSGLNFWYTQLSTNWLVQNNTIHDSNYDYGIACDNLSSSTIQNNSIYNIAGNHGTGRAISGGYFCSNNIFQNNDFRNAVSGIRLNGGVLQEDNNTIFNNTITNMTNYGIVIFNGALNTTIINNTFNMITLAALQQQPLTSDAECNNIVTGNTVNGLPIAYYNDSGLSVDSLNLGQLVVCNADNSNFSNINVTGNASILDQSANIYRTSGASFSNFSFKDTRFGFSLANVANSTFYNVTSNKTASAPFITPNTNTNISLDNITVYQVQGNTLSHIPAVSLGAINSTFSNMLIRDCNNSDPTAIAEGLNIRSTSSGNVITNVSIYNCAYGIEIVAGTNNTLSNIYIENMTNASILVNSTASGTKTVTMRNVSIAFANGLNTTWFDLYDSIAPNEVYIISPQANPYSFNTSYTPFYNMTSNISNIGSPTVTIDDLNSTWSDSQSTGYNESRIQWWYNDGSTWTQLATTLDSTNNKLEYASYTLAANANFTNELWYLNDVPLTSCMNITSSGKYLLQNDLTETNDNYCIGINSSNVQIDCQGHLLTGASNGTFSNNIGITTSIPPFSSNFGGGSFTNISTINCRIDNFSSGVFIGPYVTDVIINNNTITNSTAALAGSSAIYLSYVTNANVTNNSFDGNYYRGIVGANSNNFIIQNNTLTNTFIGIEQSFSSNNYTINNNTISTCTGVSNNGLGIILAPHASPTTMDNTNITNNIVNNCSRGIDIDGGSQNVYFANNLVNGSGRYAMIAASNSLTLFNNTFSNNRYSPLLSNSYLALGTLTLVSFNSSINIVNTSIISNNNLFTNNSNDLYFYTDPSLRLNFTSSSDNFSGTVINSYIDFQPTSNNNSAILTYAPSPYSGLLNPFANKFMNYSIVTGTPNITNITYNWAASEVSSINASLLNLVSDSTGLWTVINNTPDTINNQLMTFNVNSTGRYGLTQFVNCPIVNTAGTYYQSQNYNGSPNSLISGFACVVLNVSDITYDCGGYAIDSQGTGGQGISLGVGVNNVTIRNCNISNYFYNIFGQVVNGSTIYNNTISNGTSSGIYLDTATYNVIDSNNFTINTQGIDFVFADSYNNITNNNISGSTTRGIDLNIASNNIVSNNNFTSNNIDVTSLSSSANNITSNILTGTGFISMQDVVGTSNLYQFNVFTSTYEGIDVNTGTSLSILSNNFTSNQWGILIASGSNTLVDSNRFLTNVIGIQDSGISGTITNNYIATNSNIGLYATGSTSTNYSYNDITTNTGVGVKGDSGEKYNVFSFNNITSSALGSSGMILNSTSDLTNITDNNISNNAGYGLQFLTGVTNTLVKNNIFSYNLLGGVQITTNAVTMTNNSIYGNTASGIEINGADNTILTSNNISNQTNGVLNINSNITSTNNTLFNNTYSFVEIVNTSTHSLTISGDLFLPDNGIFANYSNISVTDNNISTVNYFLDWAVQPVPDPLLPLNTVSINQKYLLIQNTSDPLAITDMQFNWNSSEEVNETRFLVMYYNGISWIRPSQTLNTGSNYISFNVNTTGTYALFDNTSFVPPTPSPSRGIGYTQQNQSPTVQFPSLASGFIPSGQNIQLPPICLPIIIFLIVIYLIFKNKNGR